MVFSDCNIYIHSFKSTGFVHDAVAEPVHRVEYIVKGIKSALHSVLTPGTQYISTTAEAITGWVVGKHEAQVLADT